MSNNITLSELNRRISQNIKENFSDRFFIVAEISELNESRGHAYLELVEKDEEEVLRAKARATIWARTYRMLKPYFETSTGHKFEAGLKVLIVVTVEFHEVYGFSLNIKDIDPNYTVGDIERKRLLIIKKLEEEGVINMNKELEFPVVPQKIAVISSETAAGYGDFIDQLENNDYGFKYYTKLFPAAMQGEETENSIIKALDKIYDFDDIFDIVVIIRGGGSKSDLSWFDSYQLALNISQFSLPVLTGIGHDRDETITDLVAHISLKTPTAVAGFIIDATVEFYNYINQLAEDFSHRIKEIISENKSELEYLISNFKPTVKEILLKKDAELNLKKTDLKNLTKIIIQNKNHILLQYPLSLKNIIETGINNKKQKVEMLRMNFRNASKNNIIKEKHKLKVFEQKNKYLNPSGILKRGYSITSVNGKLIKSVKDVKKGDLAETKMIDGNFKSKVEN
ncbi:MAG: exodeoxyribonuclease VII large subunit [Bacteroidales bacterium]|nr:exodeoxyribonuclease VII large subunit [Bacteroidales bacterium]